jgi:acyl carrier protein
MALMTQGPQSKQMPGPTIEIAIQAVTDVLSNKRSGARVIDASTPLDELGLDSLEVAEVFTALEDMCGCELDAEPPRPITTVGDLATLRVLAEYEPPSGLHPAVTRTAAGSTSA